MKRIICCIFVFVLLSITSCDNMTKIESASMVVTNEATMDTDIKVSTVETYTTKTSMAEITTIATTATSTANVTVETTPVPTQASTITTTDDFEFHIVGDYHSTREIPFEKLHRFDKSHRVNAEKWYTDISIVSNLKTYDRGECVAVIVTVAGYSGAKSPITQAYNRSEYYVYRHSYGDYVSDGKIYRMMAFGYPEEPVYGCYRIEMGEKYLSIESAYNASVRIKDDDLGTLPFLFKIEESDGTEWVYPPLYYDLANLKCAVRITDETESLIYKPGTDDDIIAYLEKNDIPEPKIEYKCELNAFLDEVLNLEKVDIDNFTPVGDYASILDEFAFEGFAEYPENMRKNKDDPYTPKDVIDVSTYDPDIVADRDTVVKIIGYRNSEVGDDGMVYSYYYVYVSPFYMIKPEFYDPTVYIMQAYGSPSHPYYGQRRIEIGDMYLRLETDSSFYQTDEILPATKLFYLETYENDRYGQSPRVYPDFGTDFSNVKNLWYGIDDFEKFVYKEGRDDDIIAYMEENNIEPPEYTKKTYLMFFSKNHRLDRIEEHY